jgi:hypothetical protein
MIAMVADAEFSFDESDDPGGSPKVGLPSMRSGALEQHLSEPPFLLRVKALGTTGRVPCLQRLFSLILEGLPPFGNGVAGNLKLPGNVCLGLAFLQLVDSGLSSPGSLFAREINNSIESIHV